MSGRPSAPTVVDTTAFPIASASKILSRVPPPTRSGTTHTAAVATYGRTSLTVPVTRTPGIAVSRFTRGPGFFPTTVRDTSGTASRMRGNTASVKCRMQSSLGNQSMEPVNTSAPRVSCDPLGVKYVVSTPVGIVQTLASGAWEASSERSASETATVSRARVQARASYRRIFRHSSSRRARRHGRVSTRPSRCQIMCSTL